MTDNRVQGGRRRKKKREKCFATGVHTLRVKSEKKKRTRYLPISFFPSREIEEKKGGGNEDW